MDTIRYFSSALAFSSHMQIQIQIHNQNQIHKVSGGITHANFTQMLDHCGIMNYLKRQRSRRVELTSS